MKTRLKGYWIFNTVYSEYWRKPSKGLTPDAKEAHLYSKEEAEAIIARFKGGYGQKQIKVIKVLRKCPKPRVGMRFVFRTAEGNTETYKVQALTRYGFLTHSTHEPYGTWGAAFWECHWNAGRIDILDPEPAAAPKPTPPPVEPKEEDLPPVLRDPTIVPKVGEVFYFWHDPRHVEPARWEGDMFHTAEESGRVKASQRGLDQADDGRQCRVVARARPDYDRHRRIGWAHQEESSYTASFCSAVHRCHTKRPGQWSSTMQQARIRVDVTPGMFSSERVVSFRVGASKYSLIVDCTDVQGDAIVVNVLRSDGRTALVELPGEILTFGRRIELPIESLDSHDFMRSRNPGSTRQWTN